jgi:adenosylmethionine-8-amino-7-oxononanoate aminotransferase
MDLHRAIVFDNDSWLVARFGHDSRSLATAVMAGLSDRAHRFLSFRGESPNVDLSADIVACKFYATRRP